LPFIDSSTLPLAASRAIPTDCLDVRLASTYQLPPAEAHESRRPLLTEVGQPQMLGRQRLRSVSTELSVGGLSSLGRQRNQELRMVSSASGDCESVCGAVTTNQRSAASAGTN
jgi:hypothetical protein